ncbi:MAG TPA: xanthine dehydrogenase family protein molybdopterin-binding subunit [Gemmatimonadota bacterium]|nr:xanthine dehydrogenase family protein molybdopterin-binding subunit [Gemmatimonadota bacterium]
MERIEGLAKLTGAERYVDDLPVEGALWGMTVRSPIARGRIRKIRFDPAVDWSEFVVVDHRDVPGANEVLLIEPDQPILAADRVRHVHEPVVLLAHPSRDAVRRAVRSVEVVVDPEPAYFDVSLPPRPDQVQRGGDNVMKRIEVRKGDVEAALGRAARVVEGEYRTGAQEHVYIETQGMLAWEEDGVLFVQGSLQCPYYVHKAALRAFGRDPDRVRIVQAPTGGGFGGKEEYPSMIALHAALLALKAGRPVKIVYDRGEDMEATTKRHPSIVRHRTGVDGDGRLVAQDIDVVMDGGAYVTLSPVVLSRGVIHAAGPYRCGDVRIAGRAMLTNSPPHGAFRGFGAPQTHFANERHMDVVAAALVLDPIELRRRNLLVDGDETATGQVISDGTDRLALLDRAVELSSWREKEVGHRRLARSDPWLRRGMGVACFHHGAGFTGSGEVTLASRLDVAGLPDGRVEVRSANIEMGQGTLTIFTQIAAERLGVDPSAVVIAEADTGRVPNSGPTVASRTAMVVGRLVEEACDDLRARLGLGEETRGQPFRQALVGWHAERPGRELVGEAQYEPPPGIHWDDSTYRGDAYAAYGWGAYVAEVEVDLRTYGVRVVDFVALQDVGTVLNPTLARGQVQGGVAQGIGWALMEDCRWQDGAMANAQLTNYIVPTFDDLPAIRVFFDETPWPSGPRGAKGLGELPIDGPAPAVVNAIARAVGIQPTEIPLVPERLMALLDGVEADRAWIA